MDADIDGDLADRQAVLTEMGAPHDPERPFPLAYV
jgi:hypothetical protein